jgi:hypothetical protein
VLPTTNDYQQKSRANQPSAADMNKGAMNSLLLTMSINAEAAQISTIIPILRQRKEF